MPNRTTTLILSVLTLAVLILPWPAVPALAGFTPTPRPTNTPAVPTNTPIVPPPTATPVAPTNTPVAPTNTPQSPAPPGKEPKNTPLPTATLSLTSTPGVLPVGGGQMDVESGVQVVLLLVVMLVAAGVAVWLLSGQGREP